MSLSVGMMPFPTEWKKYYSCSKPPTSLGSMTQLDSPCFSQCLLMLVSVRVTPFHCLRFLKTPSPRMIIPNHTSMMTFFKDGTPKTTLHGTSPGLLALKLCEMKRNLGIHAIWFNSTHSSLQSFQVPINSIQFRYQFLIRGVANLSVSCCFLSTNHQIIQIRFLCQRSPRGIPGL